MPINSSLQFVMPVAKPFFTVYCQHMSKFVTFKSKWKDEAEHTKKNLYFTVSINHVHKFVIWYSQFHCLVYDTCWGSSNKCREQKSINSIPGGTNLKRHTIIFCRMLESASWLTGCLTHCMFLMCVPYFLYFFFFMMMVCFYEWTTQYTPHL